MSVSHALKLAPADSDWESWKWQLKNTIRTAAGLDQALNLTPAELQAAMRAESAGFPLAVTPYYLSLINRADPECGIRKQVIPQADEGVARRGDLRDPLGEEAHEVAPELVQRYPDRTLLLVSDRCAIYCRFCTRSRMVGSGGGPRSLKKLEEAFGYLKRHPEIKDVIVSGGDPLAMNTAPLLSIIEGLREIESIETIRLATRVPVALPMRINQELLSALRPHHPLWLMTHFNHPGEISKESAAALNRLADAGFPVMNQSVLLRGVNDNAETLGLLFRKLVRNRVRPYYLLQMDPVSGTAHLRTPVAKGIEIMDQLQGRLSGIALPKLILDAPGGMGKVPIGKNYIVQQDKGRTRVRTYRNVEVDYYDPE